MQKLEYQIFPGEKLTLDGNKKQILKSEIEKRIIEPGLAKAINYRHSSYGLKHQFESILGFYISNMDFKEAMKELGIKNSDRDDTINVAYPIKGSAINKLYSEARNAKGWSPC